MRESTGELIQRYETAQSQAFKEYRSWKEKKWGEDNLDEVEIDDNDVYLELPQVFTTPFFPNFSEFMRVKQVFEFISSRLITAIISTASMVLNSGFYIRNPQVFKKVATESVSLWFTSSSQYLKNIGIDAIYDLRGEYKLENAPVTPSTGTHEDQDNSPTHSEYRPHRAWSSRVNLRSVIITIVITLLYAPVAILTFLVLSMTVVLGSIPNPFNTTKSRPNFWDNKNRDESFFTGAPDRPRKCEEVSSGWTSLWRRLKTSVVWDRLNRKKLSHLKDEILLSISEISADFMSEYSPRGIWDADDENSGGILDLANKWFGTTNPTVSSPVSPTCSLAENEGEESTSKVASCTAVGKAADELTPTTTHGDSE